LNNNVSVRFHNAGHILGSAMVEVLVQDGKGTQSLVFSGDIGQYDTPLLSNPSAFDRADYVVMESTYGNRNHDERLNIDERLAQIVNDTVDAGGNVVIPTFAIERAQELLYRFHRLARAKRIPYILTFLDSPMAVEITKIFEHGQKLLDPKMQALFRDDPSPFEFPGLKLVESIEGSKAINLVKGSAVIMAGSGMITGGRIKHHLIRNITRPESALIFVGYQAVGTLGRLIEDDVSPVRIHGEFYPVRLKIEKIEGFSAHAGRDDLVRWLGSIKSPPRQVFLTHGEEDSILSLAEHLRAGGGWELKVPNYMEEYTL
jgi:metallo-beta-lactamase family protein